MKLERLIARMQATIYTCIYREFFKISSNEGKILYIGQNRGEEKRKNGGGNKEENIGSPP